MVHSLGDLKIKPNIDDHFFLAGYLTLYSGNTGGKSIEEMALSFCPEALGNSVLSVDLGCSVFPTQAPISFYS